MTDPFCDIPFDNPPSEEIKAILRRCRTIAVVGLSPKEKRDSHRVARYLQERGYRIIPVNPGQKEILGEPCYRALNEIPERVDMVNLFLPPARVPPMVEQAIEIGTGVLWMQLGIVHPEAAVRAEKAGIRVIMDRCIMHEHMTLHGRPG